MLLRARIVLPVRTGPIDDGCVSVRGPRIEKVGRWSEFSPSADEPVIDLGETVLLPGLVNAHCHLDYTAMAGQVSPPKSFTSWLKAIVALKNSWSSDEFARSWRQGAEMLVRSGCTTVGNIESMPALVPDAWRATPLRVISFRELISLKSGPAAAQVLADAERSWLQLGPTATPVGLSPHAPYTTHRQLLEAASTVADRHHWRLTTHVAESEEEFEMYLYKHGPMYDWLKNQRDMSDCGNGSPVHYLDQCGYLERNLLAVHVNYLWRDDAAVLGRAGVSVAHCPRSHAYFKHLAFPYRDLVSGGVNVCLGTDSLVTTLKESGALPRLDLFAEMAAFARRHPTVAPTEVLRMATLNSALALGCEGIVGELAPGAFADLIALPFAGSRDEAAVAAVHHAGAVPNVLIDGRWALRGGVAAEAAFT